MNRPSFARSIPVICQKAAHHGSPSDTATRHLNQVDLARRWKLSVRTLERWRWQKRGPKYLKVGGRVLYRLCDIEAFEAENEHLSHLPHPRG